MSRTHHSHLYLFCHPMSRQGVEREMLVWQGGVTGVQMCPERAKSCDLMKEDVLRGQCWPGSICHAVCFMFNYYSMFPFFHTPPSIHETFWHDEIHTTLPCPPQGPPPMLLSYPPYILLSTPIQEGTRIANTSFSFFYFYFFLLLNLSEGTHSTSFLFLLHHTPSHSLVCGVNFHYTAHLWYNDSKWASVTDFCRSCFPSLICT